MLMLPKSMLAIGLISEDCLLLLSPCFHFVCLQGNNYWWHRNLQAPSHISNYANGSNNWDNYMWTNKKKNMHNQLWCFMLLIVGLVQGTNNEQF